MYILLLIIIITIIKNQYFVRYTCLTPSCLRGAIPGGDGDPRAVGNVHQGLDFNFF